VTGRLQSEIKQTKPFQNLEEEVLLNLQRTADAAMRPVEAEIKSHGLSTTQYNVLRILRGAGEAGRTCGEIGDRLITRDPDITRLLDRMEKRGLIRRERQTKDRRVILTFITESGMDLLAQLDGSVPETIKGALGHMSERKLKDLCRLLEQARNGGGSEK
jgi:MarR family transcriptional regulator, organic hydroperoxide resistance regulator